MAARLNRRNQESVRAKIQGTQLVNLLQNHALGKSKTKVDPTRLQSAQYLLQYILAKPAQEVVQTGDLTIRWKS